MRRPSPELIEATLAKAVLWHVIYTRPACERMVVEQLDAKAIESFLPLRRPVRRRVLIDPLPRPVFARYVFAAQRADHAVRDLWNLRGEIAVLGVDNPLAVPGKVMVELFQRTDADGFMDLPGLRRGDPVTIRRDPFAGFLGQIRRAGGKEALVWVDQIGATLRLPIDAIEPVYEIRKEARA